MSATTALETSISQKYYRKDKLIWVTTLTYTIETI